MAKRHDTYYRPLIGCVEIDRSVPLPKCLSLFIALAATILLAVPVKSQNQVAAQEVESRQITQSYRINPGDQLEVSVWGDDRLQRQVTVLPDGTFSFPLVGRIMAEGYLPADIEGFITEGLRDQYRGEVPEVSVSVTSASGMQFSVVGRVNTPGNFTPGRYVNILEALSMAGGPSEFANLDNVLVVRKSGGELTPVRLRLSSLFSRGADAEDISRATIIEIRPGDTVIVP